MQFGKKKKTKNKTTKKGNLQLDSLRKKRKGSDKLRNEREEIAKNTTEIKSIISEYYEQLYVNTLVDLEEMDEFLESYNLPRLDHEDTETMNRPITRKAIEPVIKKTKLQNQMASQENSTKNSKKI